jgi:hypothetical protein
MHPNNSMMIEVWMEIHSQSDGDCNVVGLYNVLFSFFYKERQMIVDICLVLVTLYG